MPDSLSDLWLRQYHPAPAADLALVAFPHAGGAASYFQPLSAALSPGVQVLSLMYPGRQDRRSEPCLDRMDTLAAGVFDVLRKRSGHPMVLFGHSLGATLAFETARRLGAETDVELLGLIVSGRRQPRAVRQEAIHLRDDAGIISEIRQLDGTNAALLDDEDIVQMVLPALRADYTAAETYVYRDGPALRCPISVLTGAADPRVTGVEAEGWAEHTTGDFRLRTFPGGHFYLNAQQTAVVEAITEDLTAFRAAREA